MYQRDGSIIYNILFHRFRGADFSHSATISTLDITVLLLFYREGANKRAFCCELSCNTKNKAIQTLLTFPFFLSHSTPSLNEQKYTYIELYIQESGVSSDSEAETSVKPSTVY